MEKKMKKLNLAGIAVILFIALISTQFVYGQMEKREMHQGFQQKMMMEKLNLTDSQQEAVQDLRFNHKYEMIDLKADLEKKMLAMKELKRRGNYTRDEFLSKVKSISDAKENIALAIANHKMDVYELLTDDQRKIFNEMRDHSRHNMKKMKHKMMMKEYQ